MNLTIPYISIAPVGVVSISGRIWMDAMKYILKTVR